MTEGVLTKTIRITASDGWELAADIHSSAEPTVAILISAGTGFPRQFYNSIATYLAARGAIVLTYDYRGIGGSAGDDLAASGIEYSDWGRFDAAAALDALEGAAPGLPLTHLCHSVGGHFIGLMANQSKITRHAFVSVGTGFFGGHHLRNIPSELYFWWGLGSYSLFRYAISNLSAAGRESRCLPNFSKRGAVGAIVAAISGPIWQDHWPRTSMTK